MALLIDKAGYNLKTPEGKAELIGDLVDQSNSMYDALSNTQAFNVQAYTQLSITLIQGNPTGTYRTSYAHGLGYPPVVIAFALLNVGGFSYYLPLPYIVPQFGVGAPANYPVYSNQYFYVDSQNLYFEVYERNIGGTFPDTFFTAAFYIFSVPLGAS